MFDECSKLRRVWVSVNTQVFKNLERWYFLKMEKRTQPVFGPNGAVLNAPEMTNEMRQQIVASRFPKMRRRTRKELLDLLSSFLLIAFFQGLLLFLDLGAVNDRLPWLGPALMGGLTCAWAGFFVYLWIKFRR